MAGTSNKDASARDAEQNKRVYSTSDENGAEIQESRTEGYRFSPRSPLSPSERFRGP